MGRNAQKEASRTPRLAGMSQAEREAASVVHPPGRNPVELAASPYLVSGRNSTFSELAEGCSLRRLPLARDRAVGRNYCAGFGVSI